MQATLPTTKFTGFHVPVCHVHVIAIHTERNSLYRLLADDLFQPVPFGGLSVVRVVAPLHELQESTTEHWCFFLQEMRLTRSNATTQTDGLDDLFHEVTCVSSVLVIWRCCLICMRHVSRRNRSPHLVAAGS